jgi:putative DNA-invertase from lambdoid prophage Rac
VNCFNVKDGKKVPNMKEQKLITEMKKKKANGESMLAIHKWLNNDIGMKLNYSSMRGLL